MGVFDELDEKAKELAAKAKAALENKDEFLAKARERMDSAIADAKEELEEFKGEAKEELQEFRAKVADFLDRDGAPAARRHPTHRPPPRSIRLPRPRRTPRRPPSPTPPRDQRHRLVSGLLSPSPSRSATFPPVPAYQGRGATGRSRPGRADGPDNGTRHVASLIRTIREFPRQLAVAGGTRRPPPGRPEHGGLDHRLGR
jgi:hypothetical protein